MPQKTAHIIGLGLSGLSAARLLIAEGWSVIGSDDRNDLGNASEITQLEQDGMEIHLGNHESAAKQVVDLVIVSPGILLNSDVIQFRKSQGVELIGEAELGWRYSNGKLVTITGSNGKSTTTALLGEIFDQTAQPSFVCGNIGLPICDIAKQTTPESLIAMEISSYQLMTIVDFKPNVSVLLGISPDHLDYHGSFDNYVTAKSRLWENQSSEDYLIYNSNDANVIKMVEGARTNLVGFSVPTEDDHSKQYKLHAEINESLAASVSLDDFRLPGKHNQINALAGMFAALLIGVSPAIIESGVRTFNGLPHRLEMVRELNDVIYINDSKATNPESTICALEAMETPTVLIAGGLSKGGGFRMMRDIIAKKVTHLILIGDCANEIEADIGDLCSVHNTGRLWESVSLAAKLANKGESVLFSPMAASFDMFKNFEDRGDNFKYLVNKLV